MSHTECHQARAVLRKECEEIQHKKLQTALLATLTSSWVAFHLAFHRDFWKFALFCKAVYLIWLKIHLKILSTIISSIFWPCFPNKCSEETISNFLKKWVADDVSSDHVWRLRVQVSIYTLFREMRWYFWKLLLSLLACWIHFNKAAAGQVMGAGCCMHRCILLQPQEFNLFC